MKKLGELEKGLPGTSLVTAEGEKFSISSPLRFIISGGNISIQFYTPPRKSTSEGWQKHTIKICSTLCGLTAFGLFLEQRKRYGRCIRRVLKEASIGLEDILEELRSIIKLIKTPPITQNTDARSPPTISMDRKTIELRPPVGGSKVISVVKAIEVPAGDEVM